MFIQVIGSVIIGFILLGGSDAMAAGDIVVEGNVLKLVGIGTVAVSYLLLFLMETLCERGEDRHSDGEDEANGGHKHSRRGLRAALTAARYSHLLIVFGYSIELYHQVGGIGYI